MEEERPAGTEGTDRPRPASQIPPLPDQLASGEAEVRRMVEAGASSPEELRALAARLRAQRAEEEAAWRREVRPALMQSKKARLSARDLRAEEPGRLPLVAAALVAAAVVLLLLIAAATSIVVLLVPVVGVLVYAYQQGRDR